MATISTALSAILGGVVHNALLQEEKREITGELTRQVLMTDTSARIVQAHLKAEAFRAQSPTHTALYDAAFTSLEERLAALRSKRIPTVRVPTGTDSDSPLNP
jgi:DNA-binding transcriptional ArsR family regulator